MARTGSVLFSLLYFDELELSNPLGSKNGKHKEGDSIRHYLIYHLNCGPISIAYNSKE